MKPLPNLDDAEAMAARGRRSALAQARKEAVEALRDAYTALQSEALEDMADPALEAKQAAERLVEIAKLWLEKA